MALPIRVAYADTGGDPAVRHYTLAAAQTQKIGAPMNFASGTVSESANATVASTNLVGFAGATNQSAYGYDYGDVPATEVVTGRANTCPVFLAGRNLTFYGMISTGATIVAPLVTDIGVAYGLVKQSDGYWTVNRSDTTAVTVTVIGIDTTMYAGVGVVLFKVRNASLAAL